MQTTPRDAMAGPRREPDRTGPGRPALQPEDFGMGTMVSPDSLAVVVQLPAQLRRPCVYADHAVGGIGAALNGYVHYRTNWTKSRTLVLRFSLDL